MRTIRATILQTPSPERLEILEDRVITIDDAGRVDRIEPARPGDHADVELDASAALVPGCIDTHLHAPQWPQLGVGLDLPLERWLFEYTFPTEARFADVDLARSVWDRMVPALLGHGTTTAVYYASIHEHATLALAAACVEHGQRAFVGRVAMDHPDGTPAWYRDGSPSDAVDASARSIEAIRAVPGASGLVEPIVTPRFAPACTDAALEGLGELAAATGARVQTHCSESQWQDGYARDRFGRRDADALDRFGIVRPHTVLAHGTFLDDDDRALLAARGAGVAHCPLSNVYFGDRPFATRRALDAGVRLGLGTDVAGGPSPSLLAQCGHAVGASRRLADGGDAAARIDATTAFWMATAGGAELLGIDAGLLAPGRPFDALAIALDRPGGVGVDPDRDDWPRRFEKLVRLAGSPDIADVWVAGRRVAGTRRS